MMNLLWLCLSLLFACGPETEQKTQDVKAPVLEEIAQTYKVDSNVVISSEAEIPKEEIVEADVIPQNSSTAEKDDEAKKEDVAIILEPTVIASPSSNASTKYSNSSTVTDEKVQTTDAKIEFKDPVVEDVIETPEKEVVIENAEVEEVYIDEPIEEVLEEEVIEEKEVFIPTKHEKWQSLLSKYVDQNGWVDYKGFKNDEANLNAYLEELSNEDLSTYTATEKKAFFINAYNSFTIKLIVDNYPLKSILNLHGGKTWDRKWISLAGTVYSLNEIEHQLLIRDFSDSRVHFAINCAAKSCPPLSNKAFTSSNVESSLNSLTKAFLSNKDYNEISSNSAELSKLFEWYAKDFGDVKAYINKYLGVSIQDKTNLKFKEYDWALNGK